MGQRTLLLVDDDPAVAQGLAALFRKRGYVVTTAFIGQAAIAAARQSTFDGVIIDFRMPDMRGDVLYSALVSLRPELARRTVFMTGDVTDVVVEALSDTQCPIVLKPFEFAELERIVAATMGTPTLEDRARDAG